MLESLLKKAVVGFLTRGLGAIIGLIVTIALPQFLSLEDVGRVYFFLTEAMFVAMLIKFGLDYGVNNKLINAGAGDDRRNIIGLDLCSKAFTFMFLLFFAVVLSFLISDPVKIFIPLLWGGIISINLYVFQVCKFEGNVFKASLSRSVINLSSLLVSLIATYYIFDQSLYSLIFTHLILFLICTLKNVSTVVGLNGLNVISLKGIKANLLQSRAFFYYSFLLFLLSDIDMYFIKLYLTNEDLAVYGTVKRFSLVLAILVDLANLVIPNLYRRALLEDKEKDPAFKLSRQISLSFTFFSLAVTVFFFFFQKQFINMIFNSSINISDFLFLGFLSSFTLNLLFGFNEVFLTIMGEKEVLFKTLSKTVLCLVLLNSSFVFFLGLDGAVLSFLISNFYYRYNLYVYVNRVYHISLMASFR